MPTHSSATAAEPEAGTTRVLQKAGLVVVHVPGGDFLMGSADDDPEAGEEEKPQHLVHVDGFWIGQTEVTDAQYRKFIKAGGYEQRRYWTKDGWFFCQFRGCEDATFQRQRRWSQARLPRVGVSWYEGDAFARWAGCRLPTEAEWEYAARGGPLSKGYFYAGSSDPHVVAWYNDDSGQRPHPVGQKRPNELGLYDMSGNVWEWCADWNGRQRYRSPAESAPVERPSFPYYVLRGGCWGSSAYDVRCAARIWGHPEMRSANIGFRIVLRAR